MRAFRFLRPALSLVVFALLLAPVAEAEDDAPDDVVRQACVGQVSQVLADLRQGDAAAREAATEAIRARPSFFLPYLHAAAESTSDQAWADRCRELASTLPEGPPGPAWLDPATFPEFPSFERGAISSAAETVFVQGYPQLLAEHFHLIRHLHAY